MDGTGADAIRQHGSALIERLAEYLETVEQRSVSTPEIPAALAARFDDPLPRTGMPAEGVWDDVWDRVVGDAIHLAHPMYMGHQVAPPLPQAALADLLASLLNQSLAVWEMSPTATVVEQQVIRWLIELAGFPTDADGTLVSGGSVANLTGLLAARSATFPDAWEDGVGAASGTGDAPDGATRSEDRGRTPGSGRTPGPARTAVFAAPASHYSVERALGVLGVGAGTLIRVPERDHRMDPRALASAIRQARREGRTPLAVVATAGSTATGVFDDLEAIADVAAAEGVWLHVDGAHGASFLASPRLRDRLRGIERADSLAWDPHKMMLMPMSTSVVLFRDRRYLDAAFDQSAPYLFHPRPGETRSRDTGERTLQCSRRFDALKLWVALRHYGIEYLAALQEYVVENAATLHRLLVEADDFEPAYSPEANILCFRWVPGGANHDTDGPDGAGGLRGTGDSPLDELQRTLRDAYNASGRGWITTAVLDGRRVLRVTLMNPRTRARHLEALIEGLREVGDELVRE